MRILTSLLFCLVPFILFAQCDTSIFDIGEQKPINTTDLFLTYSFEEDVNDNSGNDFHAAYFSGDFVAGVCGKGLEFNGNDFVLFPAAARFIPRQSASVSFWMKTTQTTRFDLIDQRIGSWCYDCFNFGLYFNCCWEPEQVSFVYPSYTGPSFTSNLTALFNVINSYNDGQWHHYVYIKDVENSVMQCYQDGCLLQEESITDVDFLVQGNLTLGKHFENKHFFNGIIDEFKIFNRALTQTDVDALRYSCAPLEVEQISECQACIHNPQAHTDYFLIDSEGEILDSITQDCPVSSCFNIIDESLSATIQAVQSAPECDLQLSTLLQFNSCSTPPVALPCELKISIPNVFTPNQDGINDVFQLMELECAEVLQLTILDRWGQTLFKSRDRFSWDGNLVRGKAATEGVYFWVYEIQLTEGEIIEKTGFVQLMR